MATYQDSRYNIALPTGAGGSLVLIKTITASSDSTISFVNGASDVVLDSTYRTYIFKIINAHPSSDGREITMNFSDDTSSHAYNLTKTTSHFRSYNNEGGTDAAMSYIAGGDLAQSTGVQNIIFNIGNGNDESGCSEIWLFNPSSTTYVKHFIVRSINYENSNYAQDEFIAGYVNTTAAVTAVQFGIDSGNIDAGTFKLYGIA